MKPSAPHLVVLALVAAAMAAPSAVAAGHPCAPLVTDPRGDAQDWAVPAFGSHPDLDITALNAGTVGAGVELTLRLVDLHVTAPAAGYHAFFRLGAYDYGASAQRAADGTAFSLESSPVESADTSVGDVAAVDGSLDVRRGTVTWRLPFRALHGAHTGTTMINVVGATNTSYGPTVANAGYTIDRTDDGVSYRLGSSRC